MIIKRNSITNKILKIMIVGLLIQALLFFSTIFFSDSMKNLNYSAFSALDERIEVKCNQLQSKMDHHLENIYESNVQINSKILKDLKNRGITTKDLNSNMQISAEVLDKVSQDVMLLIKKNKVTGAFLILDTDQFQRDENDKVKKCGLYIKNKDPFSSSNSGEHLSLIKGPEELASDLKVSIDTNWESEFLFDIDNNEDFFYKPINAYNSNKKLSIKNLGYWNKPFNFTDGDKKIMTYTLPLIDVNGNAYGIMGIDISLEYLNKELIDNEVNNKDCYLIGSENSVEKNFEDITCMGTDGQTLIGKRKNIDFNKIQGYDDIYLMKSDAIDENKIYGCRKYINLYADDSPFKNEKLVFVGITAEDALLNHIQGIRSSLLISLSLSTIICILTALLTGNIFTKPIRDLADKVKKSDPKEPLKLENINICEIDDLSVAITSLSEKVADSSSKLSQIIELLNMPIGAFECKKDERMVFCTEAFFNVIGVKYLKRDIMYIDKQFFNEIMIEVTKSPEVAMDGVYKVNQDNGEIIWIKLKTLEDDSKTLGVVIDVTQDVLEKQRIEYERDYDILTGILNRRAFYNIVNNLIQRKRDLIAAFVMWDLDNLKYVNDTYGHDYGDKYIKEAAQILKKFQNYGGIVARRSGDEFLVFIYGDKEKIKIRKIIEQIHEEIENASIKLPNDRELKLRVSTGIAWYPDDAKSFDDLAKYSDFAMYKIKTTAKGSITEFNKEEYKEDSFLLDSQEDLNKLLDEQLLRYVFQPIVDAQSGEIYAYEALMRSELKSLKNPLHIIKLATADSRLYEIEKITFFKALEAFVENKEHFGKAKLFINSIPNYALNNDDLMEFNQLYGEYAERLVVELLENERSDVKFIKKKKQIIERWNGKIAIDDFGSGYNNEAVLLDITPDFVKIDMQIVRNIDKDLNRQQISKNLISYAKQRSIKIVAEGVETKEELQKLIEFGVDYIQGYYLGKPQSIPDKISENKVKEILCINTDKNINK